MINPTVIAKLKRWQPSDGLPPVVGQVVIFISNFFEYFFTT